MPVPSSPALHPSSPRALLVVLAVSFGVSGVGPGLVGRCAAVPSPPKSGSSSPVREEPSTAVRQEPEADAKARARTEAEALYAKGYAKVEEAKKERDADKEKGGKNAKKKFKKALGDFEDAVARAPDYFEAWNMIGYCARNLGDLERAFSAYEKALTINPEYEEAHEYRGEAYILSGDLARAKAELAWLQTRESDEAEELAEKIERAEGKGSAKAAEKSEEGESAEDQESSGQAK